MSSKLLELPDTATDLVGATLYVVQGGIDKQAPAEILLDILSPLETAVEDLQDNSATKKQAMVYARVFGR